VNKKTASEVKLKVEHLNALAIAGLPLDTETAQWVAKIGDELANKLNSAGLIPERKSQRLGAFLDNYLELRARDGKPNTVRNIRIVADNLIAFLGRETDLRDVKSEDAEKFKLHYIDRGLAQYTICRQLRVAKHFFKVAIDSKLISENPFARVRGKNVRPTDRIYYVPAEDAHQLIRSANPTWRIIVALCRFAGLRCPSEVLSLKWEDVNFAENRMVVTSPKTSHIEGKGKRIVPIFTELQPFLRDAFELSEPGEPYVIGGKTGEIYRQSAAKGWKGTNMRTQFERIIHRAGLLAWPKLFHSLRSSCETDLASRFPIHVCSAWLGNTPNVAITHYLQTLESDFRKATTPQGGAESGAVVVQKAVQSPSASKTLDPTGTQKALENQGFCRDKSSDVHYCSSVQSPLWGVDNSSATSLQVNNLGNSTSKAGAESGAVAENPLLSAILSLIGNLSSAEREAVMNSLGQRSAM